MYATDAQSITEQTIRYTYIMAWIGLPYPKRYAIHFPMQLAAIPTRSSWDHRKEGGILMKIPPVKAVTLGMLCDLYARDVCTHNPQASNSSLP